MPTVSAQPQLDLDSPVSFAAFMQWALYGEDGYYRQQKQRVGQRAGSDFYTSVSLGPLFGELIAASIESLLGPDVFDSHTFVEIGAEPESSLFANESPFKQTRVLRLGQPLELPPKAIVFSNELLDAQPFHRFRYTRGAWHEWGVVRQASTGTLHCVTLPHPSAEAKGFLKTLQNEAPAHPDGYTLDISLQAETLISNLLSLPWQGLFLTFDYGRCWEVLLHETPQGTARAYHQHTQSSDLLARPGQQDLTCDVCWDRLEATLRSHGLCAQRQRQEAFFMHHASACLQKHLAAPSSSTGFNPHLQALKALLLPPHLGHAFSALWAVR